MMDWLWSALTHFILNRTSTETRSRQGWISAEPERGEWYSSIYNYMDVMTNMKYLPDTAARNRSKLESYKRKYELLNSKNFVKHLSVITKYFDWVSFQFQSIS